MKQERGRWVMEVAVRCVERTEMSGDKAFISVFNLGPLDSQKNVQIKT